VPAPESPWPVSSGTGFRPTRPLPQRLVRLGVVLDTRNPPERVRMIARMCELAGIHAVWVRDGLVDPSEAVLDPWEALVLAASETRRTRLGAMLDTATRGWDGLRGPLQSASQRDDMAGRLEVTLCGDWELAVAGVEAARRLGDTGLPAPIIGVEVHSLADMRTAARLADDVLVPIPNPIPIRTGHESLNARVAALAAVCEKTGRQLASMGVAVQLPVSVGRTETEAQARAVDEALFAGDANPAIRGIFGTLEMCQDRVIELAHAGVTDLRCVLPNSADVHDVIAQLTAMVIGSVDVLRPGAPRSKAPDAPSEWGGRPRFPLA
jgi:alkanesulfonate monooxygenase SsuD/methylene tetrahydromethanopterin reductase-like flavin-dependent oxidoreductase (luciferase family)